MIDANQGQVHRGWVLGTRAISNFRFQISNFRFPISSFWFKFQASDFKFQIPNFKSLSSSSLLTTDCCLGARATGLKNPPCRALQSRSPHRVVPTAFCPLPTAYCLLPTAYSRLPTAFRLQPTAYSLLPTLYGPCRRMGTYPCGPLSRLTPRNVAMMVAKPKIAT